MNMKLPYKEGTWFAIPLRQGGYAAGRIARHSPEGRIILAYFFGPKRELVPTLDELEQLAPDAAMKILQAGDLGLIEGRWPIIGDTSGWRREEWPVPTFVRKDEINKLAWRIIYADDDPNHVVSQDRIPYEESSEYERDLLSGAGAAEIKISRMLS